MKAISKAVKSLTKIIEVGYWVAVGLMSVAGVLSVAAPQLLKYVMDVEGLKEERVLSVYGLEVTILEFQKD